MDLRAMLERLIAGSFAEVGPTGCDRPGGAGTPAPHRGRVRSVRPVPYREIEKIPVTFTHVERHGRKTYRAGGLYLSLEAARASATWPCARRSRRPKMGDHGRRRSAGWLVAQGLSPDRAARLVAAAIGARRHPIIARKGKPDGQTRATSLLALRGAGGFLRQDRPTRPADPRRQPGRWAGDRHLGEDAGRLRVGSPSTAGDAATRGRTRISRRPPRRMRPAPGAAAPTPFARRCTASSRPSRPPAAAVATRATRCSGRGPGLARPGRRLPPGLQGMGREPRIRGRARRDRTTNGAIWSSDRSGTTRGAGVADRLWCPVG